MKESQTYQTMLKKVENLIQEVSQPDIDLDQMIEKVEKGYSLIQTMRERLEKAKVHIDELHQKFEETSKT